MTKELSTIDKTKQLIMNSEKAFKAVLPENFNVQKFIATFCLEVQKNPNLAECTNLIEVARDVASFGLIIGGLANQAYLIPYQNWKTKQYSAQLIVGYKGYITKLEEAGYTVEAEIVTNAEVDSGCFQEIRGSESKIIHNPIRKGIRDRENIALAYCIIKGKDTAPVISVLSKEEIEEIAKTDKWVEGANGKKTKEKGLSNVWLNEDRKTDFGQQCIKTVIRNCVKKVNLRIANEMSAYEGQVQAEAIKDITPLQSKTANAHDISDIINQRFEEKKEIKEVIIGDDEANNIEEAYERVHDGLEKMKTQRAVNAFWEKSAAEDINLISEQRPDYLAALENLKKIRLSEVGND